MGQSGTFGNVLLLFFIVKYMVILQIFTCKITTHLTVFYINVTYTFILNHLRFFFYGKVTYSLPIIRFYCSIFTVFFCNKSQNIFTVYILKSMEAPKNLRGFVCSNLMPIDCMTRLFSQTYNSSKSNGIFKQHHPAITQQQCLPDLKALTLSSAETKVTLK